ncbi:MAG: polymer-forming cytoskeletal protein [Burkholderiaceae bacterium]|jgi:cytoskeletal protein CcmA (bactofilin family)|nr:polymer-forming cytoskeletal protein [Burkholderiaceae bacterium]
MLGMKKQQPAVRSAVGPGMRVLGEVMFQEGLQVDGTVMGNVIAAPGQPSALIVTETGHIEGVVRADQVVIGGTVIGPVESRDSLELLATAHVQGDVRYHTLEMQPGAVIAGQLQPQLTPPPNPGAPEPEEPREEPRETSSAAPAVQAPTLADVIPRQVEPRFDI